VYTNDLENSINEVINILPPQQKRIFYLSRGKGYSYEKIAQKLDISVRTVENQIYRTLREIRKHLAVQ
jgi:RNA polymerase sigma-70 factor (ECF subfamily)